MNTIPLAKLFKRLLWALLIVWCLAFTAERLVWVNMASYPAWLAQTYSVPLMDNSPRPDALGEIADAVCQPSRRHSGMTEISQKANGLFIRCGWELALIPGHNSVYRITNKPDDAGLTNAQ